MTMETTNQHARGIIGEEMNKISKELPQGQLWHRLTLRSKKPGRTKSQKIAEENVWCKYSFERNIQ